MRFTDAHFALAIIGMIAVLIAVHMGHSEVSSALAFMSVGASGSSSLKDVLVSKTKDE
jgi:hypothetical protein